MKILSVHHLFSSEENSLLERLDNELVNSTSDDSFIHELKSKDDPSKTDSIPPKKGSLEILTDPPSETILSTIQNIESTPFHNSITLLQQWECVVEWVEDEKFGAKLCDLTNPDNPTEGAVFFNEEIFREELHLICPGAVFYWNIGYEDSGRGRKWVSIIQFRRLPAWTKKEISEIKKQAKKLGEFLGFHDSQLDSTTTG